MRDFRKKTEKKNKIILRAINTLLTFIVCFVSFFAFSESVHATQDEFNAEAEARKSEEVQTNNIENWPQGPRIGAKAAILMEANTGTILYAKDIDEHLYPASITKLMCCLVAVENCDTDKLMTVSQLAVDSNDPDGSCMGLRAGESITLEELLYGIIINSANEACNVVAENIGGSIEGYVDMMNERAKELGCTGTHFVTPNGLHNEDHYTTAHDMALIGRAFFQYDLLCKIATTSSYTIKETDTHQEFPLHSKNKLYPGQELAYADLVGSKTGFTSHSRQTLVSCAERGGMRLVAVILMEETPAQFTDTAELFDYGFSNFTMIDPADFETGYNIDNSGFFNSSSGLFGSTAPLLSIGNSTRIVLPNTLTFDDLTSHVSYDDLNEGAVAKIEYTYHTDTVDIPMGSTDILLNESVIPNFDFQPLNQSSISSAEAVSSDSGLPAASSDAALPETDKSSDNGTEGKMIKIQHIFMFLAAVVAAIIIISALVRRAKKRKRRIYRRKKNQKRSSLPSNHRRPAPGRRDGSSANRKLSGQSRAGLNRGRNNSGSKRTPSSGSRRRRDIHFK
ncbi:MAG: D-alanyl-D-alanine carboxypeptidase [Lachnospiraceae bacterium]|nr:D-alanyl-D-alanine carboxypeptidase [Lachnospiraceae bacterium]